MSNCGNNCNNNTLFLTRPTSSGQSMCTSQSPFNEPTLCAGGKLGKRKSREKVREQMKNYALRHLGAPVIKIELTEDQIDNEAEYVLQVFEEYAPREYYSYWTFNTTPGKSVYLIPDYVGHIRNVFYREQPGMFFNGSDLGGVLPIEYYYPGGAYSSMQGGLINPTMPIYGRMGEFFLYTAYSQMYARLSSQLGGWEIVDQCYIKLYPTPCRCNWVIVHYLQKRTDFKEVNQALIDGLVARLQIVLGHIRGKYQTVPSPSGGTVLNGQAMLDLGEKHWETWMEERIIKRWSDLPPITMD